MHTCAYPHTWACTHRDMRTQRHTHVHIHTPAHTQEYLQCRQRPERVLNSLELELQTVVSWHIRAWNWPLPHPTSILQEQMDALYYWAIYPFHRSCIYVHTYIFTWIHDTESLKADLHAFWWNLRWNKPCVLWKKSQEKWVKKRSHWVQRTEGDRVRFQQQKIIWCADTSVLPS